MSESSLTDLLQSAIQDIKQGNLKAGKAGLARIIKASPDSAYAEKAWIWMSVTFDDPEQKRVCLENALKINPDNDWATKGLKRLPQPMELETVKGSEEVEDPVWLTEDNMDSELIFPPRRPKKAFLKNDPSQTTLQPPQKSDQQLIDEYIAKQTTRGWQIISRSESSVQLRKPKQWSNLLLVLGLLLLCAYIVPGLIVLLIALIDYLSKEDEVEFIEAKELRTTTNLAGNPLKTNPNNRGFILKLGFALTIILCGLLLFIRISNSINSSINPNRTGSSSNYSVTFRVIGVENRAIVTYGNSANTQPLSVQLPWQYTVSMKYGDTAALITQGETNKTTRCEIWVDGQLRTSATSSQAMDNMAVCGYVVGRNVVINAIP